MKIDITTPTQDIIREMYEDGIITHDLYINGGVSIDLILLYRHEVIMIQQDPEINFEVHRCNNVTISGQIKAYIKLIDNSKYDLDEFTAPLIEGYVRTLNRLRNLKTLLTQSLN